MTEFTPGPWQAKNDQEWNVIIGNIDGPDDGAYHYSTVCDCDPHDNRLPEQRANARLVAAAPALLRAVQNLLRENDTAIVAIAECSSVKVARKLSVAHGEAFADLLEPCREAVAEAVGCAE